jgi:hypothetical protein
VAINDRVVLLASVLATNAANILLIDSTPLMYQYDRRLTAIESASRH